MSNESTAYGSDQSRAVVEVPPSGSWDGDDGPWSTFAIDVGSPPQSLRVLVSTCSEEPWVVSANRTQGGCSTVKSQSDCPELRGGLFNTSASTTWGEGSVFPFSFFNADFNLPDFKGSQEPGNGGYDTFGFGSGVRIDSQRIVTYATDYWHLGLLGVMASVSPGAATSQGSILSSLKDSGITPSLTFAYSAGARYRANSTASLTFGGYDTSKFIPNSGVLLSTTQSSAESSGGIIVNLDNIIVNNAANMSLLPNGGIAAVIEASIPHLWLPLEVCSLFEQAFGIVYNSTIERYLVNETLHRQLQTENPSVSFILDSNSSEIPAANFTLPYGSFDLELDAPLVDSTQRYFPLRRAENGSQYVLGRTFLQEAYLIVDCERATFSMYPMAWDPAAVSQLTTIKGTDFADYEGISPAREVVAIVVIVISICSLIIGLTLEYQFKERSRRKLRDKAHSQAPISEAYSGKPEMDPKGRVQGELHADNLRREVDNSRFLSEMPAGQLSELGGPAEISELRGTDGGIEKEG